MFRALAQVTVPPKCRNRARSTVISGASPLLPFSLQNQHEPLLPDQVIELLHATGLQIDTSMIEEVDRAFVESPPMSPQTPLHDTVPPTVYENAEVRVVGRNDVNHE
jgi:hypothetical protein